MSRRAARAVLVAVATAAVGLGGCGRKAPAAQLDAAPKHSSAETIPDSPIAGSVAGTPFTVRSARYYVKRSPTGQRIDIKLSDATSEEPCGALSPVDGASLWIRFDDAGELRAPSELQRAAHDAGPYSIHYQIRRDERWGGSGDGAALLAIRTFKPDAVIAGDLSVCFADGLGSCAAGAFSATYCPDPVDPSVRNLGQPGGRR